MDKVKAILQQLKKHHFWVLCLVVLITGLIGWYTAASAISTEFKSNLAKVESEVKELDTVINNPEQANEKVTAKTDEVTTTVSKKVLTAWQKAYSEQKENVLKWPEAVKEIESVPLDADIDPQLRERYRNFIGVQFPRLLQIVGALSAAEMQDQKPAALAVVPKGPLPKNGAVKNVPERAVQAPPPKKYKVIWDTANQDQIQKGLQFPAFPTTAEVRQIQENLWVYEALVRIIAEVNRGATFHYQSPIKRINEIAIAADAAKHFADGVAAARIFRPTIAAGQQPTLANVATTPLAPIVPGGANTGSATENRYVDAQGRPLAAGAAMPVEFKRIPVFLRLVMDQRKVPDLLVACANSPLPVEVRQLRINPKSSGAGARGAGVDVKDIEAGRFDLTVELHGIVYIFNPPDEAKIGTGEAASATGAPAPVEASND